MAINIEDFRKSLNVGLSRDLVQKILTKYENFDFSSVSTNNGTKLREIDSIDKENDNLAIPVELSYFLNNTLKLDYLSSRGIDINNIDVGTLKKHVSEASNVIKKSLYSRPNTLTISSKVIRDNPQKDESSHILTINTDSASIISIVNSLYYNLSKYDIPFDIEIPRLSVIDNGYTEAIKLHVATMDLEDTIKAIAKLDKPYRDKIKTPNMFNANVQDLFGYDSVIDINGTRASDLLGVAIVKALDKTLVDLAKDETFDNVPVAEYLRNAENKDEARKQVMQRVKTEYPNIIDPVLIETMNVIKEENLATNPDNIFVSDMASSELNVEFGVMEDEITNVNEIEVEKEEEKTSNVIKEAAKEAVESAKSVASNVKSGVQSIHDLFANQYIQPAITFGTPSFDNVEEETAELDPSEKLKVENPTVTVVEPIQKENEFNELSQPKFDSIDENVQPVLTANSEETKEEFVLPGEEAFNEPVQVSEMETGIKEVITPEVVEPKEVTPIVAPAVDAAPIVVDPQMLEQAVEVSLPSEVPVATVETVSELPSEVPQETENPVVEEAVGVPVEDSSEVEIQKATEVQPITEPVVPSNEPVIKDDTAVNLDETQVLPVVKPVQETKPELPSGIKEVITPEVNPVPPYNPQDYIETPEVNNQQTLQTEVEQKLKKLENIPVDTRTIEIPTEEIKEENDILSAISSNLEMPDSSKLSTEEKIAVVADTFTKQVDPVIQAKKDKYNGIFIDNQILDFQIRDENNEVVMNNGVPKTLLDYLEENHVLDEIKLDSKYYIRDDPKVDYVDGINFIRDYVAINAINGNNSLKDIMEWYVKSVTNINEQPKKKGIFGFGKK